MNETLPNRSASEKLRDNVNKFQKYIVTCLIDMLCHPAMNRPPERICQLPMISCNSILFVLEKHNGHWTCEHLHGRILGKTFCEVLPVSSSSAMPYHLRNTSPSESELRRIPAQRVADDRSPYSSFRCGEASNALIDTRTTFISLRIDLSTYGNLRSLSILVMRQRPIMSCAFENILRMNARPFPRTVCINALRHFRTWFAHGCLTRVSRSMLLLSWIVPL